MGFPKSAVSTSWTNPRTQPSPKPHPAAAITKGGFFRGKQSEAEPHQLCKDTGKDIKPGAEQKKHHPSDAQRYAK